ISGTGSSRTVTVTPLGNQSGNTVITLTARDPEGATASSSFKLTVNALNDPPTISTIANQTIAEDSSTAALAFVVGDVESAAATLAVSARSSNHQLPPDSNLLSSGSDSNRTIRLTPAADQNGATTITVTVSDGISNASSSFVLTVTPVNDPPTLNPISNLTLNEDAALQTVPLSGIGSGAANESQPLTVIALSSNPAL